MAVCSTKGNRRGCGRPIKWVRIATTGALMPIDTQPTPNGNVQFLASSDGDGTPLAKVLTSHERDQCGPSVKLYTSHFATCPFAQEHRRR